MTTARIVKDKSGGNGLWLFIKNDIDEMQSCSFPITADEVDLIRDACEEWLKSQKLIEVILDDVELKISYPKGVYVNPNIFRQQTGDIKKDVTNNGEIIK